LIERQFAVMDHKLNKNKLELKATDWRTGKKKEFGRAENSCNHRIKK
jgi:hypothetical protein